MLAEKHRLIQGLKQRESQNRHNAKKGKEGGTYKGLIKRGVSSSQG